MTQTLPYTASDQTRAASRFAHVVPLAFITYGLAYLDRVNYGSAESRLRGALHLSAGLSAFIFAMFFLGYFVFQIPGAIYAAKRNVKWLVFWALILWGGLSALTGLIRSVPLLIADRLLLGAVEGVVLPAMLIYLTRWFTKPERSRANSLLMLANPATMAVASVLCGFLIQFFDIHRFGHLAGWQMMFVVEGLPSWLWAFIWLWLAEETPAQAPWLLPDEAAAVQDRLDNEQLGIKRISGYAEAFSDPRVIRLALMFMCLSSASYGLMMWLPQIVEEGTKRGVAAAGLLTSLPYLLAIVSMLVVSWLSDRTLRRKRFVVGSMFTGCAAFCLSYLAGPGHFWIAFAGLMIVGSCNYTACGPLWAWMTEMLSRNVVGESMALVNSIGALGGFIGTMTVGALKNHYHSTGPAFMFQACCFAIGGILAASVRSKPKTGGI